MSGIQEGSPKTEFTTARPITQLEFSGPNLPKPPIMISSMNVRTPIPFPKGQPVVAKVVQTLTMGQQTPNILVVGQARMAQPSSSLIVPVGGGPIGSVASGVGGFIVGGNVLLDKNSPANAIVGSLQTQQLQQQSQLLQQQQPHQQNILNSLVTLSGGPVNVAPINQSGSLLSASPMVNMADVTPHNLIPGTANLQNRIVRSRPPLDNRMTLQPLQANAARPARPNVVPLAKPNQFQLASSSSPPNPLHMVAMATLAMSTTTVVSGSAYIMPNAGQRVILSGTRAPVPQLQRAPGSNVSIRSPWPAQMLPLSSPAATSYPVRSIIPTSLIDTQQRSPSVTVQPLIRPTSIYGNVQQQQQASRTVLSPPLTAPINLSINTIISSASSVPKSIVVGQNQALNLSQPIARQPTVILASTSVTKSSTSVVATQQVNKIISQSPLNLTKPRKLKLPSGSCPAYSTLSLAPASTPKTGGMHPASNINALQSTTISTAVPVAKVIPQLHIVNSGPQHLPQQIQLHQIQASPAQLHVQQQPQQTHLVAGSTPHQLRVAVTSVQSTNLVPLQSANAMLIGGSYNIIPQGSLQPASTVLHTDKPHLLQQLSIQDGSRYLTSQGTHLIPQNPLGLITIPASATIRPPNTGSATIMTSSLTTASANMTPHVTSRMQPVVLSIDSNAQALHQNFAFVAAPTVMAAAAAAPSTESAATDLSQKESLSHQLQQQPHYAQLGSSSTVVQPQKTAMQHQLVSLPLPSSSTAEVLGMNSLVINGNNSAIKQQNQSPRPPSILRKRTHDSSMNVTKKNLFAAPSTSILTSVVNNPTASTTSTSSLLAGNSQLAYFQQNLSSQNQQQNQLFLHQPIGPALTASEVVVKLSGVVALGPSDNNNLQFVVPTSPRAFDAAKDSSQSSTDTASSTENTPKLGQALPSDMNRSCKVNVVASSNGTFKGVPESVDIKIPAVVKVAEEEVKLNSRKKPRKQQLVAQPPSSFPSGSAPQKDAVINDEISSNGEEDDNPDEEMEETMYALSSAGDCPMDDASSRPNKDIIVEKEFVDNDGVRWTRDKQHSCALITNQYQCSWKPRNNHFSTYNDFKLKEDKKSSVSELSNQKCILQKVSGYKLYLLSDHLNYLKEEEEEMMRYMEDTRLALSAELQGLNMSEEFQSTNELIMAYTQRSKKCIEQLEEEQNSLLKLLAGKVKANEIISKHQSKRVVKKKDRS